jgi:hypothetical protein
MMLLCGAWEGFDEGMDEWSLILWCGVPDDAENKVDGFWLSKELVAVNRVEGSLLGLTVGFSSLVGNWLDRKLGGPVFTDDGKLEGFGLGFTDVCIIGLVDTALLGVAVGIIVGTCDVKMFGNWLCEDVGVSDAPALGCDESTEVGLIVSHVLGPLLGFVGYMLALELVVSLFTIDGIVDGIELGFPEVCIVGLRLNPILGT